MQRLVMLAILAQSCVAKDLACLTMACTGGALSMSGLAAIVDPSWRTSDDKTLVKRGKRGKRSKDQQPKQQAIGGLALVGWGITKLAVLRHAPHFVTSFARLNLLAAAALYLRGVRNQRLPGIPERAVTILAGLYACVGLGLKGIPRPGPDRFRTRASASIRHADGWPTLPASHPLQL